MEFVAICQELWGRRLALAIAFVVALLAGMSVLYHLPSLKKKSLSYGSATTQFLLDSNRSSLANASTDLSGLATRAAVFTRFMTSPEVQAAVARHAGVPATRLSVDAPVDPNGPQGSIQPPAERRSSQLSSEADRYRVFVQNEQSLPVVDVYAQAPDASSAVRLANAAVLGMQDTLTRMRSQLPIATAAQLRIEQLGTAQGGEVNQKGSKILAFIVFLGVFVLGCVAIVVSSRLSAEWRLAQGKSPKPAREHAGRRRVAAVSKVAARAAKSTAQAAKSTAQTAKSTAQTARSNGSSNGSEADSRNGGGGGSRRKPVKQRPTKDDQPPAPHVKNGAPNGNRTTRAHARDRG